MERSSSERKAMEKALLQFLAEGQFLEALSTLYEFEASQVFPRGLNVDWSTMSPEADTRFLELLFSHVPLAASETPSEWLLPCRIGAAMFHLVWNVGEVTAWLKSTIPDQSEGALFKTSSDMCSHASFLSEVEDLASSPFEVEIHVLTCNDQWVCSSCRSLAERSYNLANVPELPNPDCTSGRCRCGISAASTNFQIR